VNRARAQIEWPNGEARTVKEEILAGDKFARLCTPGAVHASVAMMVGRTLGYGAAKVSAHVTLACDQNARALDAAAELACMKALEYMNDAFTHMEE
jgi:hypothetical protein